MMRDPKHDVIYIVGDHAGHRRDQQRRVLVIGMKHDDDVGAGGQSLAIAGLLVASVAVVAVVLEDIQAQLPGEIDGVVGTVVVHQNADVDQVGQFSHRDLQSFLRVVSGHDDRDALAVDHLAETKGHG